MTKLTTWQATIQDDDTGAAIVSPVVTIRLGGPAGALADLFDIAGSPISNPVTGGLDGFVQVQMRPGRYWVQAADGGTFSNAWYIDVMPEEGLSWETRSEFVTDWVAGMNLPDGAVISAGGVQYEIDSTATAISDLVGVKRFIGTTFDHFGSNDTPGTTDMSSAFSEAANWSETTGEVVYGITGATYLLNTVVTMGSGVKFDLSQSTVKLGMFTSDITDIREAVGAIGFNMSGQVVSPFTANSNQMLRVGKITSGLSDGQFVDAVLARNCSNVDIRLGDVTGVGIMKVARADTLSGSSYVEVYAHDLGYSTSYAGLNAANSQITGIDIDDSRVNGVDSEPIEAHARCENLQITGAALTNLGGINQTDAMTVANGVGHFGTVSSKNCGEALDVQADHCVFNVTDEGSNASLKLIHGASFNNITVSSKQPITSGVIIAGGTLGRGNVEHNKVFLTVDDVDPSNVSTSTVGMVKFEDQATGEIAQFNEVFVSGKAGTNTDYGAVFKNSSANNVVHLNVNGAFASNTVGFVESTDGNIVHVGTASSATVQDSASGKNYVYNAFKDVPDHGVTSSSAYPSGTQNIPISTATKVQFDTENFDRGNDYDTVNYRSTPGQLGPHGFDISIEFNAAVNATLMLYKNGALYMQQEAMVSATRHFWSGTFLQEVATDYWELYVSQPDGTRNITASSTLNRFNVFKV